MSTPPANNVSSGQRACPQCGRHAATGRRFCGGCRAVLVKPCAACGFGNERDDVWCGGCGASLQPRAAVGAPAAGIAPAVAVAGPRLAPPPPPPPLPSPSPIRGPAVERPVAATARVADLLAINARRSPLVGSPDASDQERLDELFGDAR